MDYKNPAPSSNYVNKDFQKIFPEMLDLVKKLTYRWDPSISNESDPGVILTKLNAIISDKSNYNIDKAMLEYFPDTVAQEQDAYSMFRQLGYYPKWFISATTDIVFKYTGANKEGSTSYGDGVSAKINRFTQLSDDSRSLIYTITGGDVSLDISEKEKFSEPVKAIQGTIHTYSINGDELIRFSDLDSKRRLYFDELNVAQNGIFIYNDGKDGEFWEQTDNLYAEELTSIEGGSFTNHYSFGLSRDLGRCYVEFAEDADECIGGGIRIKYITSDGFDGNAPARAISRLFENSKFNVVYPSTSNTENTATDTIELNEDNLIVRNESSSTNGRDSETIDSMYRGYQRTVGTFNTLVSIRDYINFVLKTGLVSNGFVCDRLDDIQSSYKIVVLDNDINIVRSEVIEDNSSGTPKKELSAFDLRMYLNTVNTSPLTSMEAYQSTFDFLPSSSVVTSNIIEDMEDISQCKCVLHDFQPILTTTANFSEGWSGNTDGKIRFCGFRNKYEIVGKIVPQYDITTTQRDEIETKIRNSLYRTFNAFEVDYGNEADYDTVYSTIMNADDRIKSLYLNDFKYKTYGVVWDGYSFKEIDISATDNNVSNCSRDEIVARSILAGITDGWDKDSRFNYNLNMNTKSVHLDNVETIETIANISWDGTSPNYSYNISSENENIVLYRPSAREVVDYSTYTKYTYSGSSVQEGTIHRLGANEYINFSWKENSVDRSRQYGQGTLIRPDFNLSSADTPQSLGSSYSVSILDNTTVTVNAGTKCYWILNNKTSENGKDKYLLFNSSSNQSRILEYGEYFIYADSNYSVLEILGSGTKLEIANNSVEWSVDVPLTDAAEDIEENGLNADIRWFESPIDLLATEMEVVTLGKDTTIAVVNASSFDAEWVGNNEYLINCDEIKYKVGNGEFIPLTKIDGSSDAWNGVSRLNINMSPDKSQELLPNHKIILNNNSSDTIDGSTCNFVKSSVYLEHQGSKYIDVRSYNLNTKQYSNSSFIGFNESTFSNQSGTQVIPYEGGWKVSIPYDTDGAMDSSKTYWFNISDKLPAGNYAFAVSELNADMNISDVQVKFNTTDASNISESDTSRYFGFSAVGNLADTNLDSVSISITRKKTDSALGTEDVYIRHLIKYEDGNIVGGVKTIMGALDSKNEFDYGYSVDPDVEIEDPTNATTFFDPNHVFNKFTIPCISNISINITNVKGQ